MIEIDQSPLAMGFVTLVAASSIVALGAWIWRWARQGYVLAPEPRSPVPWGLGAALPAVLLTLVTVILTISGRGGEAAGDGGAEQQMSAQQFASEITATGVMHLGLAAAIVVLLIVSVGATPRDLGWPATAWQAHEDAGLGLWIALASLIPIYAVQVAAMLVLEATPTHPLLDQIQADPDPLVFAAALLAAAVVAPIFEELLFRLLLQGGLERWESDRLAGRSAASPPTEQAAEQTPEEPETPAPRPAVTTPAGWVGLPPGWAPILASSFLFALAHLGHGPSPIALFIFAMFLGYAYQRTHRLLPCIVAHMTLNVISVTVMFLGVSGA